MSKVHVSKRTMKGSVQCQRLLKRDVTYSQLIRPQNQSIQISCRRTSVCLILNFVCGKYRKIALELLRTQFLRIHSAYHNTRGVHTRRLMHAAESYQWPVGGRLTKQWLVSVLKQ